MADMPARIAVIGGANVDIGGFPDGALMEGDSCPGRVRISAGGVGRNIAENAARLGLQVHLVTALGDDENGRMLLEDCRKKGLNTQNCLIDAQGRTSVYLFIDDPRGDVRCAVSDMEIQKKLIPEYLSPLLPWLNAMDAVVMDANLPEESIRFLCENLRPPIFADAVSVAKAAKLRSVLSYIHCLKPNRMEAEVLTGMTIRDALDAAEAARRLNGARVARVYLSLGEQGALCAEGGKCGFLPCISKNLVNVTGAGDAFTAALVWACLEGMDLRRCGAAGMAAAAIALSAMETVSPDMNRTNLMKRMADVEAAM